MTQAGELRPRITVATLVAREGRLLFVEEESPQGLVLNQPAGHLESGESLAEAAKGIEQVAQLGKPVELAPRSARIRRVQHQLVESKRYASESVGEDPQRRLRILPSRL